MAYKNKKEASEAMHRWYLANKPKVRKANRRWRQQNPEKHMIICARRRAKKFHVPISITMANIFIPEYCPVLRIKLKRGPGKLCDASPSLDRIIPSKGYVPGNVVVISNKANSIKRNATSKEIRKVADWLEQFE